MLRRALTHQGFKAIKKAYPNPQTLYSHTNRLFSGTTPWLSPKRYMGTAFPEKVDQMSQVEAYVKSKLFVPNALIHDEVTSFYENLGIDDMYFQQESVQRIGDHIIALYGAKVQACIRNEESPEINLIRETETGAVYIHRSSPGISHPKKYETMIDSKYLDLSSSSQNPYRLESYLSTGKVSATGYSSLRCYLIRSCDFVTPNPKENEIRDINLISDKNFLYRTTKKTQDLFQKIILNVLESNGPVLDVFDLPDTDEKRLVIGFKRRSTSSFFSAISEVFHYHGLATSKKFVDQFSNGVTICSFYLTKTAQNSDKKMLIQSLTKVMEEASLIYCLPHNPLVNFVHAKTLSGIS